MIFHGGFYYYSESRNQRQIFIRRSRTIAGIGLDPGVCVWKAPGRGLNSDNVWAPELHLIRAVASTSQPEFLITSTKSV